MDKLADEVNQIIGKSRDEAIIMLIKLEFLLFLLFVL
jgi:hypothetical protein